MEAPAPAPWPALGVLLIRDGLVSRAELEAALAQQGDGRDRRVSGQRLGEALVERGAVTSEQVARLVAEQHELPFVDLHESDSIGPVATSLPEDIARRCSALPIRLFPDGSLLVAVADPGRLACLDDIRRVLGVRVRWAVAAPDVIAAAIEIAAQMTLRQAEENEAETDVLEEVAGEHAVEPGFPSEPVARKSPPEAADTERRPVLGSLLLRDGLVTEDELDAALAQQRLSSTRRLGEILVGRGALTEAQVSRALAEQHELPFIDLTEHEIDTAVTALLPVELARRHSALPVSYLPDGSVVVVIADPTSAVHDEELRGALDMPLQFAVGVLAQIDAAIASALEVEVATREAGEHESIDLFEEQDAQYVLELIRHALSLGASSIHFTPQASGMIVRARIAGNLSELATIPLEGENPVANELGLLAGVDVTSRPRHSLVVAIPSEQSTIELRMSAVATILGTRVTLRVDGHEMLSPSLFDLFAEPAASKLIRDAIRQPRGLFAICGPSGSGRTTTLYAAIRELNTPDRAVLTIEDPVENLIPGVDQTEVDASAGVTSTSGLRTILRSDPDIVAVGELVDSETADSAVRGALDTLVLTTLVAPTASAGVRRLTELGGDPGLLGAALTGVVAQQLVRKTCLACRETYYASVDELAELGLPLEESGRRLLGRGRGCVDCDSSGYRGLTSLVEVLPLTDDVRALVAENASASEIERTALEAGMRTLRENGIRLCLEGVITTAELRDTLGEMTE